ncbi:hypothetical protein PPROV_000338000 [Pycnococcus provasolii]|uniref:Septum formation inhibitor MinC C-terminal domain-containing protein n=1 Tax=Pycnococcus provasolii TaxID=41880 RepID=A0A830HB98_9CHLO|nr:hypothetical protein PPROV_000338000 [Pycnococcus provasolii]
MLKCAGHEVSPETCLYAKNQVVANEMVGVLKGVGKAPQYREEWRSVANRTDDAAPAAVEPWRRVQRADGGMARSAWKLELSEGVWISQVLNTLIVKRTLRGGQLLKHPDGDVVILGDVNRESAVVAGGDVVVWGALRGEVHAGCNGDDSSEIMALEMEPTAIRIASKYAAGPEDGADAPAYPEVARVDADGAITLDPATRLGAASPSVRAATLARRRASGSAVNWSPAAKASLFTGAYITAVGFLLLVAPVTIFSLLFDPRTIAPGWIQVFGTLCVAFGTYYLGAAWGDANGGGARGFYAATVVGRSAIFLTFCMLVAARAVQQSLLVLGIVNLLGALAMFTALRNASTSNLYL